MSAVLCAPSLCIGSVQGIALANVWILARAPLMLQMHWNILAILINLHDKAGVNTVLSLAYSFCT